MCHEGVVIPHVLSLLHSLAFILLGARQSMFSGKLEQFRSKCLIASSCFLKMILSGKLEVF